MTEPDFWHERWRRGEIGFHRDDVHPHLRRYWEDVRQGRDGPVLVPLAGKSLDLRWLAERGHAVTGVELDVIAVRAFFDEAGESPIVDEAAGLERWRAGSVVMFRGDFFRFQAATPFDLFYDRAALVALPPDLRPRYLAHLAAQLAPGARGLLVTLDYPQECMDGPPFSVGDDELAAQPWFDIEPLAREEALSTHPRFAERGLPRLHEAVYRLVRGPDR
jgi:thiopurine S-methyltransferase